MKEDNYFTFLKTYFKYTTKHKFLSGPSHSRFTTRKRDRLPRIVIGYSIFIATIVIACISIPRKVAWVILGILHTLMQLQMAKFSFLYYFVLYCKIRKRNLSINDKLLTTTIIPHNIKYDLQRVICKYYNIVSYKENIFLVKCKLLEEDVDLSEGDRPSKKTLKITSNAIYFNRVKIFDKIMNLEELDKFFKNNNK